MTTIVALGGRLAGGYHGTRLRTTRITSAASKNGVKLGPWCSGWSLEKLEKIEDGVSITGIASASASAQRGVGFRLATGGLGGDHRNLRPDQQLGDPLDVGNRRPRRRRRRHLVQPRWPIPRLQHGLDRHVDV